MNNGKYIISETSSKVPANFIFLRVWSSLVVEVLPDVINYGRRPLQSRVVLNGELVIFEQLWVNNDSLRSIVFCLRRSWFCPSS